VGGQFAVSKAHQRKTMSKAKNFFFFWLMYPTKKLNHKSQSIIDMLNA
jgi:hypothetical protein